MMTRLYIIRHGETEWNKVNRTQGCGNNLSLSSMGLVQARAVAKRFSDKKIDAIYSSDLKRAYETASEISAIVRLPVIMKPGLKEMNFGCWEGLTSSKIKERYNEIHNLWISNPRQAIIPEAETLDTLHKRTIDTVNEIINQHRGKNIIIVSHGITIKVLILGLLRLDVSNHSRIRLDNTGVSIIDCNEKGSVLSLLNDTCHL
jgi:probable phosphoglycerate mutase